MFGLSAAHAPDFHRIPFHHRRGIACSGSRTGAKSAKYYIVTAAKRFAGETTLSYRAGVVNGAFAGGLNAPPHKKYFRFR
jgi:hypothetical protein